MVVRRAVRLDGGRNGSVVCCDPMPVFQVDVWHCRREDGPIHNADWRRYVVEATDAVEAELIACQMAARFGHAVEAVVVDWPAL